MISLTNYDFQGSLVVSSLEFTQINTPKLDDLSSNK